MALNPEDQHGQKIKNSFGMTVTQVFLQWFFHLQGGQKVMYKLHMLICLKIGVFLSHEFYKQARLEITFFSSVV
jgi:hypothetical protein